jgi:hypothetical protein
LWGCRYASENCNYKMDIPPWVVLMSFKSLTSQCTWGEALKWVGMVINLTKGNKICDYMGWNQNYIIDSNGAKSKPITCLEYPLCMPLYLFPYEHVHFYDSNLNHKMFMINTFKSIQSGWQWTWSCPELHMGGFRGGGWQFLTFGRCH